MTKKDYKYLSGKLNAAHLLLSIATIFLIQMIVVMPLMVNSSYFEKVQASQSLFFLCILCFSIPCAVILSLTKKYKSEFRFSPIDIGLLLWIIYLLSRMLTNNPLPPFEFAVFSGLVVLYLTFRLLPIKFTLWVLTAFVLSGFIQAVYGNLQLLGYLPSHHNLFKITGGFFNPGPYGGFLAVTFPASMGLWLLGKQYQPLISPGFNHRYLASFNQFLPILALFTMLSILVVLPATQSRAAWVSIAISTAYLFWHTGMAKKYWEKLIVNRVLRTALPMLGILVILVGIIGLYLMKKDSADGRLFIYRITLDMIADKPLTGHGQSGFQAGFMNYQASFFTRFPDSSLAWNAGDGGYAFNEYLQHATEYGAIGLFLLLAVLFAAFLLKPASKELSVPKTTDYTGLLLPIARGMLLSLAIFAMISYPSQIVPMKVAMVFSLACIARCTSLWEFDAGSTTKIFAIGTAKIAMTIAAMVYLTMLPGLVKAHHQAQKDWLLAYQQYGIGAYPQSLSLYERAMPVMLANGNFVTNYGKALSMAGQHEKAIEVIKKALAIQPGIVAYTTLGDSYRALGQYTQAEAAYIHAANMNPSRFYPKYLLANLYQETGQTGKAQNIAETIVNSPVKIPSTAINEIKEAMNKLLVQLESEKQSPINGNN
jgi:O-antigen polymerase